MPDYAEVFCDDTAVVRREDEFRLYIPKDSSA